MHLHLRLTFSVVFLFGLSRESIDMQLNTSALSTVVLHYQQQRTVRYSAVLNKINISCTQFKLSHLCTFARLCLLLRTDILLKGTRAATIHTKERERERERELHNRFAFERGRSINTSLSATPPPLPRVQFDPPFCSDAHKHQDCACSHLQP